MTPFTLTQLLQALDSALGEAGTLPPTSPLVPALTSGVSWPVAVFPGGLVVRQHGRVVGGVGVGGSTDPSNDAAIASAAAEHLTGLEDGT